MKAPETVTSKESAAAPAAPPCLLRALRATPSPYPSLSILPFLRERLSERRAVGAAHEPETKYQAAPKNTTSAAQINSHLASQAANFSTNHRSSAATITTDDTTSGSGYACHCRVQN